MALQVQLHSWIQEDKRSGNSLKSHSQQAVKYKNPFLKGLFLANKFGAQIFLKTRARC